MKENLEYLIIIDEGLFVGEMSYTKEEGETEEEILKKSATFIHEHVIIGKEIRCIVVARKMHVHPINALSINIDVDETFDPPMNVN